MHLFLNFFCCMIFIGTPKYTDFGDDVNVIFKTVRMSILNIYNLPIILTNHKCPVN